MTIEEAKTFLNNLKVCIEEHPIVADWLVEIADRKTEPQTEDWHDDCNTCRWHDDACTIPCCDYEPKDEPQKDKEIVLDPSFAELSDEQFVEAMKLIEPQSDARKFLGYVCETCKHRDEEWDSEACDGCCENDDHYEPQTDIGTSDTVYSDTAGYVPRVDMTDCSWQKGE